MRTPDLPKDFQTLISWYEHHLAPRLTDEEDDWDDLLMSLRSTTHVRRCLTAAMMKVQTELSTGKSERSQFLQECRKDRNGGQKRWLAYEAEYVTWHTAVATLMGQLTERNAHVKLIELDYKAEAEVNDHHLHRQAVKALTLAIYRHQLATEAALEPTEADQALWKTLEAIQVPESGSTATLMDLLEENWAQDA